MGHDPPPRLPGGRGGGTVGGPGRDGAGPSGEGSSLAAAEVVAKRAHADVVEVRIPVLTAQVEALEDFQGRVDHLTHGMLARGFMDDFEEAWLEKVMDRERDY